MVRQNITHGGLALRHATSALMILLLVSPAIALAGDEKAFDPQAEEILDAFVKATGGMKAYDMIKNRYAVGKMEMPAMGISFSLEQWNAKPHMHYMVSTSDALGEIENGSDGEVVWEISLMTGPRIYEGKEKEQAEVMNRMDRHAYWREVYDSASYAGIDSVDGAPCDKLTVWNGQKETLYFDEESHLLLKFEAVLEHQMGKVPLESYFEDYREVDGISIPFVSRQNLLGQSMVTSFDSVAHNIDMPDGIFELPPMIQELMESEDSTETE